MAEKQKKCSVCGISVAPHNLRKHILYRHPESDEAKKYSERKKGADERTKQKQLEAKEKLEAMRLKKLRQTVFYAGIAVFALLIVSIVAIELTKNSGDNSNGTQSTYPQVVIDIQGYGIIKLELYNDRAPVTVTNFLNYVRDNFFDGTIFHRVMNDFMIQGGGFGPGLEYKNPTYGQITNEASTSALRNQRGTIAMARTSEPHSATSQFFINHADNSFLDWDQAQDGWGYCAFGRVIEGMDIVDAIASVSTHSTGGHENVPVNDVIVRNITKIN